MFRQFSLTLALGLAFSLPLWAEEEDHLAEVAGIRVLHAWTPASDQTEGFVYLEVENTTGTPVTLAGAVVAGAGPVELVGYAYRDGVDTWTVLPGVEVAPGAELELAPQALALRVTGWTTPRNEGDEAGMTVLVDTLRIDAHVAVEAEDATAHSHAGHSH